MLSRPSEERLFIVARQRGKSDLVGQTGDISCYGDLHRLKFTLHGGYVSRVNGMYPYVQITLIQGVQVFRNFGAARLVSAAIINADSAKSGKQSSLKSSQHCVWFCLPTARGRQMTHLTLTAMAIRKPERYGGSLVVGQTKRPNKDPGVQPNLGES